MYTHKKKSNNVYVRSLLLLGLNLYDQIIIIISCNVENWNLDFVQMKKNNNT